MHETARAYARTMNAHEGGLSPAQLAKFDAALRMRRSEVTHQLEQSQDALSLVREARSDGAADDEHDPEGPTMSAEWSRIAGTPSALDTDLAAIDRALLRTADGSYGTCVRCSLRIALARLQARPEADLCIDCATATERR